ncbi:DUF998 domain-containing protein [Microbacterium sp. 4R-513]|uniref:DUF998 domain-containing protein n=1 Tax=Microbacterium sp. 4R-513 TaxID=2567934 RepID=UPI0013E204AE|nr:DUF998 domain-containing protein [Microbacterium sp. 4R-513]QIG38844.1 DUF998 domain-containing protein [Microbacterium sp. 4R-513]
MPEPLAPASAPDGATTSSTAADAPAPSLRVVNEGLAAGLAAAVVGVVLGLVVSAIRPGLPLSGGESFGDISAIAAGVVAGASSGTAYWRSRHSPGQEWRLALKPWRFAVNAVSVVVVHTILGLLGTVALYYVLSQGFIGLTMEPFWAAVLMAINLFLAAHLSYVSSSRMTTQRMSTLLVSFIGIGALTATITAPEADWWTYHFSQLGTFHTISSWIFNGTLIAGGLLVTTFAVYVANDLHALVDRGILTNRRSPRIVSTVFVVMGIMLAFVGIVPVDVNLVIHNLSATGMAVVFLGLLIAAPRVLRGMPRTFFLTTWGFLAALVISVALFVVGYFGLTAFEIIVFSLVFAWIAVFIRFLGVAAQQPSV